MSRLRKRERRREALSRDALRIVLCLAGGLCLLVTADVVLVSRTNKADLFDLVPRQAVVDGRVNLAWYELERGRRAMKAGAVATGSAVRALGYMTAGAQRVPNGQRVTHFVVIPDAGNAIHPAHKFGDQMIEVHLPEGEAIVFSEGQLVWVWGRLQTRSGNPNADVPLYELSDAHAEAAHEADIPKYFR